MAIANPRLHAFVADTVEDAGNRNHTNGTPLGATTDDQCKEHDVAASKDKDKVF